MSMLVLSPQAAADSGFKRSTEGAVSSVLLSLDASLSLYGPGGSDTVLI